MVTFRSIQCHPVATFIINFWHSGTLALTAEHQTARMSEIYNEGYTWMAKCNQLTALPFKGLKQTDTFSAASIDHHGCNSNTICRLCYYFLYDMHCTKCPYVNKKEHSEIVQCHIIANKIQAKEILPKKLYISNVMLSLQSSVQALAAVTLKITTLCASENALLLAAVEYHFHCSQALKMTYYLIFYRFSISSLRWQETHQMRYLNMSSLYFATPLVFNAPDRGFPWDDLRKILHRDQEMAKLQNGE